MLPAPARLRRSRDFRETIRAGRRAGRGAVVLHLLTATDVSQHSVDSGNDVAAGAQVGFVVSKGVGGAVVRNTVVRRLRHLLRPRLGELPAGSRLVVRARPSAAGRDSTALQRDITGALARLLPTS